MIAQTPQTIEVLHRSSVGVARRASKALAKDLGFYAAACEVIGIAATELGTNLI